MAGNGTATLDFGVFPGASDASVAVTGQAGIVSGSLVEAWIRPVATADHTADEHMLETLNVFAGNIVGGTGFTIYGFNSSQTNEPDIPLSINGGDGPNRYQFDSDGTRIYGTWTIAWAWN